MILHEMFPTVVLEYNLGRKFTEREMETFDSVNEMKFNMGNLTSKNKNVLDLNGLENIKEFLLEKINEYIKFVYNPKNNIVPYITQSWINYTEKNQWHHRHNHENSFISGVFYINASENFDNISFYNDGYNQISLMAEEYTKYNSHSWKLPVKSRDLLLFPSRLIHMVEPTKSEVPRISLSFNVFIKGICGSSENMTELVLI